MDNAIVDIPDSVEDWGDPVELNKPKVTATNEDKLAGDGVEIIVDDPVMTEFEEVIRKDISKLVGYDLDMDLGSIINGAKIREVKHEIEQHARERRESEHKTRRVADPRLSIEAAKEYAYTPITIEDVFGPNSSHYNEVTSNPFTVNNTNAIGDDLSLTSIEEFKKLINSINKKVSISNIKS